MTELDRLCRAEWGRLLSALIRDLGDIEFAEEALQDAFTAAVAQWSAGPPRNPRGWLYATARHKAIDRMRRHVRFAGKVAALGILAEREERLASALDEESAVPDERLRLIFTCCHPALAAEAQVALTLRTLSGLTTEEIAHAFLVAPATMAQRLVRAKAKIRQAAIPYLVPGEEDLPERLAAVMTVVYLVFNEGYAAAQGEALVRRELCAEAIRLASLLRQLLPSPDPELETLLALMLLHDARRETRVDHARNLVLLADQDRSRWDRTQIEEGRELVQGALRMGPPGPYALEASIAAVHAEAARAEETDWRQIAALYERLREVHPSPIVALNHAAAVSMAEGPRAALPLVEALERELGDYHLWHATRADLLRRLGRKEEAARAYRRARELTENEVERRFLARRLEELQETERGR